MFLDWIIFLHVSAVLLYFTAHGVSIGVALRLRRERVPERVRTLLDFSDASRLSGNIGFLLLLATGVLAGFLGHLWDKGWLWTSLGLFLVVTVVMGVGMTPYFNRLRKAVGCSYSENGKRQPGREPGSFQAAEALIAPARLTTMTIGGVVVSVAILYLMMFKPF